MNEKNDKKTPPTKGIRTHVILIERNYGPKYGPKFAGYAIDGHVTRDGKKIPVEEHVKYLNERKPDKRFYIDKVSNYR